MRLRDIEVMNDVAVVIVVCEDARARTDRQLERKAALELLVSRVHTYFHRALPNGAAVPVSVVVAYGVKHSNLQGRRDRIIDIQLVYGMVQLAAVVDNAAQIRVQVVL